MSSAYQAKTRALRTRCTCKIELAISVKLKAFESTLQFHGKFCEPFWVDCLSLEALGDIHCTLTDVSLDVSRLTDVAAFLGNTVIFCNTPFHSNVSHEASCWGRVASARSLALPDPPMPLQDCCSTSEDIVAPRQRAAHGTILALRPGASEGDEGEFWGSYTDSVR
jgi:hypothetical protein